MVGSISLASEVLLLLLVPTFPATTQIKCAKEIVRYRPSSPPPDIVSVNGGIDICQRIVDAVLVLTRPDYGCAPISGRDRRWRKAPRIFQIGFLRVARAEVRDAEVASTNKDTMALRLVTRKLRPAQLR